MRGRGRSSLDAALGVVKHDLLESALPLFLGSTAALAALLVLFGRAAGQPDSILGAFQTFSVVAVLPLALLAARRVIARDLARGGPALLESLPVRPGLVLPARAALVLLPPAVVLLFGVGLTVQALHLFSPNVPADTGPQLARGAVAAYAAAGGAAVLLASLGRHRVVAAALLAAGLLLLDRAGTLRLEQLPPVRLWRAGLMPGRGAVEEAVAPSLLLGAAALGAAFVLGALRGRVQRWAAGPLGRRELGRAAALLPLLAWAAWPRLSAGPAIDLDGPTARAGLVAVRVARPDAEGRAAELARRAAAALEALAPLGVEPPPVAVDPGGPGDPWTLERLPARGVLRVRADLQRPGFDPAAFEAALLHAALADRAPRRGPWRAVADGAPLWLALGRSPGGPLAARVRLLAAWAASALGGAAPGDWDAVRARTGDVPARALAAEALLRLGDGAPDLVRAALSPVPARPELDALWSALEALGRELPGSEAAGLGRLPRLEGGEVWREEVERGVALGFRGAARGAATVALLHVQADAGAPAAWSRDEATAGGPPGRSATVYPNGARLLVTLAVRAPELEVDLIDGWRPLPEAR